ncbi:MAG: cytochrome c [Pseudomonadota bacterium]|nr:cytochrome c [Pseudomonadota bacterium]
MKPITKTLAALAFAAPVLFSGAAVALDGEKLFQEKTCFTCHGKDGKTPILPIYPKVAGQNKDYALAQMKDIQSGARNNGQAAAMKGIMHLVSDEEMEVLAAYLETLAP